ncbi:Histone deacetylase 8 [Allomyces javanicus]|nr:Histone deacetylase 8 [Allomyces javanicus]
MVHGLIRALEHLDHENVEVIPPAVASPDDLLQFHTRSYLEVISKCARGAPVSADTLARHGLEDDCPVFRGLAAHIRLAAGGSITAARTSHPIAIHWDGGRHHARAGSAAGFCYVNDVALCVQTLLTTHARVLVFDVDIHHGDAMDAAFRNDARVLPVSIHHALPGFYPGTGAVDDGVWDPTGKGPVTVNVPIGAGCGDETYCAVVDAVVAPVMERFRPSAVVVVCGADAVYGDPKGAQLARWTVTPASIAHAVREVRQELAQVAGEQGKLVILGGGYHHANTARTWAHVTAACLDDVALPATVPDHAFAMHYAPLLDMVVDAPDEQEQRRRDPHADKGGQAWRRLARLIDTQVERVPDHRCAPDGDEQQQATNESYELVEQPAVTRKT